VRANKEQLTGVFAGGNASACIVLHRRWTQMRMFLQGEAATRDALLFNQLIHAKKNEFNIGDCLNDWATEAKRLK
jgi:hypothetical protein